MLMDSYFIRHGQVGLRCIEAADESTFLRWHNDPAIRSRIGGAFPFNREMFQEVCCSRSEQLLPNIWFAVCWEGSLLGIVGLHNVKYVQKNAELAILIGEKECRRKGIGKITVRLMEEYAFGTLALHRLYALVYSDNVDALRFFQACQWEQEGVLREASYWNFRFRDVVIWSKINFVV